MNHEISIAFQTDKSAQEYIALAKLVNQYDFDAITVYCDAPFHPSYAPLLLMAPHIERARIGTAAISPSRIHPMDIASQHALLSELAQGGTYLGLARGAWLVAHAIQELQPPIQAVREAVDVIRYFLSGQSGGYQGKVFQIAEYVQAKYPLPEKMLPVLIGSWGKKLCALAGELADEVKIGGSANPDVIPVIQDYVAVGEQKAQRKIGSVGVVVGAVTVIDEDREQARYLARREVALYLPIVAKLDPTVEFELELATRLQSLVEQDDLDTATKLISDNLLDRFAFSGNAEDIIQQTQALFLAGASRVEFGTPHGIHSETGIRLLGEKVLPALQSSSL